MEPDKLKMILCLVITLWGFFVEEIRGVDTDVLTQIGSLQLPAPTKEYSTYIMSSTFCNNFQHYTSYDDVSRRNCMERIRSYFLVKSATHKAINQVTTACQHISMSAVYCANYVVYMMYNNWDMIDLVPFLGEFAYHFYELPWTIDDLYRFKIDAMDWKTYNSLPKMHLNLSLEEFLPEKYQETIAFLKEYASMYSQAISEHRNTEEQIAGCSLVELYGTRAILKMKFPNSDTQDKFAEYTKKLCFGKRPNEAEIPPKFMKVIIEEMKHKDFDIDAVIDIFKVNVMSENIKRHEVQDYFDNNKTDDGLSNNWSFEVIYDYIMDNKIVDAEKLKVIHEALPVKFSPKNFKQIDSIIDKIMSKEKATVFIPEECKETIFKVIEGVNEMMDEIYYKNHEHIFEIVEIRNEKMKGDNEGHRRGNWNSKIYDETKHTKLSLKKLMKFPVQKDFEVERRCPREYENDVFIDILRFIEKFPSRNNAGYLLSNTCSGVDQTLLPIYKIYIEAGWDHQTFFYLLHLIEKKELTPTGAIDCLNLFDNYEQQTKMFGPKEDYNVFKLMEFHVNVLKMLNEPEILCKAVKNGVVDITNEDVFREMKSVILMHNENGIYDPSKLAALETWFQDVKQKFDEKMQLTNEGYVKYEEEEETSDNSE